MVSTLGLQQSCCCRFCVVELYTFTVKKRPKAGNTEALAKILINKYEVNLSTRPHICHGERLYKLFRNAEKQKIIFQT